jgi:hypothetical protein
MTEMETTYENTATDSDTSQRVSAQELGSELPRIPPPVAPPSPIATTAPDAAVKSKGGAPAGNRNSYRHGLFSPRGPAGASYIDRAAGKFRRHLEDQVLAVHGEISTLAASLIQTAAEAARTALAELSELRELIDADKLDPQHRTAKRAAALKALDLRDRKVKELGITWRPDNEPAPADAWAQFDEERRLGTGGESPQSFSSPRNQAAAAQVTSEAAPTLPRHAEKPTPAITTDPQPATLKLLHDGPIQSITWPESAPQHHNEPHPSKEAPQ